MSGGYQPKPLRGKPAGSSSPPSGGSSVKRPADSGTFTVTPRDPEAVKSFMRASIAAVFPQMAADIERRVKKAAREAMTPEARAQREAEHAMRRRAVLFALATKNHDTAPTTATLRRKAKAATALEEAALAYARLLDRTL